MRIDAHQHFWTYDPKVHSWISSSMKAIQKDFMPHDLASILKYNQIDGCVAVQAEQSEKETDFLLKCTEEHPFIKGVVGWLDLCSDDIETALGKYSKNPFLKGLRHIVQDEPDDYYMLRPDFRYGISKLDKYGLTYDILIYPRQLPAALELVKEFPKQRFIIDHMAKPKINGVVEKYWAHYMKELGKHKNVFCKVSGLVTETSWGEWRVRDFYPYLDVIFDSFGIDRIVFGSDWPVCLLSGKYHKVLSIVLKYVSRFSKEAQDKIVGLNAISFYNLTETP